MSLASQKLSWLGFWPLGFVSLLLVFHVACLTLPETPLDEDYAYLPSLDNAVFLEYRWEAGAVATSYYLANYDVSQERLTVQCVQNCSGFLSNLGPWIFNEVPPRVDYASDREYEDAASIPRDYRGILQFERLAQNSGLIALKLLIKRKDNGIIVLSNYLQFYCVESLRCSSTRSGQFPTNP